MKLVYVKYNDKSTRDPQGAFDFFMSNAMSYSRMWVDICRTPTRGNVFDVNIGLSDFFAQMRLSFDTREEALAFAAALPFDQPQEKLGGEFYLRFIADKKPEELPA